MPKVTIGQSEYDAFASVADADNFLAADVQRAAAWSLRNADAKARGLVSATRMLLTLTWCDAAPDPAQLVPAVVVEVTAQLAADLLAKPKLAGDASGASNIKSVKAGSAAVEFFGVVKAGPPLPAALWNALVRAGLVGCVDAATGDDGDLGLYVSGGRRCVRPYEGRYADDLNPDHWPGTI